jgi:hypothetical protein
MMFKIRQGFALQQSPKLPDFVSRFLQEHQILNLMEGYQALDSLLFASIIGDSKLMRVPRSWFIWIHEELQLDPLRTVDIRPIHLLNKNECWEEGFTHRRRESSGIFRSHGYCSD